jgi:hypothetical protein
MEHNAALPIDLYGAFRPLFCSAYWAMNVETKKQRKRKQTHTQGNNKYNEGKQHRKNTNGNVLSVTT